MQILGALLGQSQPVPHPGQPQPSPAQPDMLGAMVRGVASQNPLLSALLNQPAAATAPGRPVNPQPAAAPAAMPMPPIKPTSTPAAIAATSPQTLSPTQRSGPAPALADQLPALFESQNKALIAAMRRQPGQGAGDFRSVGGRNIRLPGTNR